MAFFRSLGEWVDSAHSPRDQKNAINNIQHGRKNSDHVCTKMKLRNNEQACTSGGLVEME